MYNNSKKAVVEISDETLDSLDYKNTTVLMSFVSDQAFGPRVTFGRHTWRRICDSERYQFWIKESFGS